MSIPVFSREESYRNPAFSGDGLFTPWGRAIDAWGGLIPLGGTGFLRLETGSSAFIF